MTKLVKLLRRAHAIETGAYEAYEGHWRSLPDGTKGQNTIKAIQLDELHHKEAVARMLKQLDAEPSKTLDFLVWCVGKSVSISCRFMGYRTAMWGAKIMESMGSNLYKNISKVAVKEGYPLMALELDWMQSAEEDHEKFIMLCLRPSKESGRRNQNSTYM